MTSDDCYDTFYSIPNLDSFDTDNGNEVVKYGQEDGCRSHSLRSGSPCLANAPPRATPTLPVDECD